MKHLNYVLCLLTIFLVASCDKDDDNTSLNATDVNFLNMAAISNRAEVELAGLALIKSPTDSVKMFAQMMIADHTKGIASLDSIATLHGLTLPANVDSMHAAMKVRLGQLAGYTFDTAYMKGQVVDHLNAIQLHQTEASAGNNQDIRNFANNKIPALQMHWQMASTISSNLH